jgi:NADPH:quinone reductase-like Zn-dependent oxidoreductase
VRVVRLTAPGGLDNLRLLEEEVPHPGPGELLVRIRACSLNFHDYMVALGRKPCADGRVPLSDGAGEVVAVGDSSGDEFEVGDVVVSTYWPRWLAGEPTPKSKVHESGDDVDGYAREYVCMPATALTKAPTGYTASEAATLTCAGVTAWRALIVCGHVKPGDTVLILGTGSVSLFALQFAKAAGARVIATSSAASKLEQLRQLGADLLIDYKAVPAWGQIRVSGISVGSRADQEDMIRAITANRLRPIIDRRFPLEQVGAAFRRYESPDHFGKVCLEL